MNKNLRFDISYIAPNGWNEWVAKNDGYLLHTTSWDESLKGMGIGRALYLRMFNGPKIVSQALLWETLLGGTLLLDRVPKPILRLLTKIPIFLSLSFHMAPVFAKGMKPELIADYLSEFWTYLLNLAGKNHCNIGPATSICFKDRSMAEAVRDDLGSSFDAKVVATIRVQVEGDEQGMLQKFDYSRRKNIRRAQELGITVSEAGLEEIKLYQRSLFESWKDYGLSVGSLGYYSAFPKGGTRLFFAYDKENLVGGNGVIIFGNTCMEFSIFVSRYEKIQKTRGGDLLKWEIVKYCLRHKIKIWDLNMIDLEESEEKTKRINFYKLQWGGEIYYGVEVFYLNPLAKAVRLLKQRLIGK